MEVVWSDLAQYSTHGIYDARYTSWVSGQDMVIRNMDYSAITLMGTSPEVILSKIE